MPECTSRTAEERTDDRWERIVGKALKDWVTALMRHGFTRKQARNLVLDEIAMIIGKENAL